MSKKKKTDADTSDAVKPDKDKDMDMTKKKKTDSDTSDAAITQAVDTDKVVELKCEKSAD